MLLNPVVTNLKDVGAVTAVASGLNVGVLSWRKYPGVGEPASQYLILYSSWCPTGISVAGWFIQAGKK